MAERSPDTCVIDNPLAELEAREATIAKNVEGMDTSAQQQAIGEELLMIRDRQLYKAAGITSFTKYLASHRNRTTRGRAYQLMSFAQKREASRAAGRPPPENERQARLVDAAGNKRERCRIDRVQRAMAFLANTHDKLTLVERRELIHYIRMLLNEMEQRLNQDESAEHMSTGLYATSEFVI